MRETLSPPPDEATLSQLPIFPLPNCVLLPGGLLPLHVFEPRYRELTRDCLAGAQLMAIALELFTPIECANYIRHCGYRVALPM